MKKVLAILMVAAFVFATTAAFAVTEIGEKSAAKRVKCCFPDGQCANTKKQNCELKKGKEVSECSECPGVVGGEKKKK